MLCHPPKSLLRKVLEELELKFRIESFPIVGLLCLLIINAAMYLALSPFAVSALDFVDPKNVKYLHICFSRLHTVSGMHAKRLQS